MYQIKIFYLLAGCVIILFLVFAIYFYNKLTRLKNKVEECDAIVNVFLMKRQSLYSMLINLVEAYAKHESGTLESVTLARAKDCINNGSSMNSISLSSFVPLMEKYPDLKANELFLKLQNQIQELENELLNARKQYNAQLIVYNTNVMTFPTLIFSNIFGFKKIEYADAVNSSDDVKFSL